MIRKHKGLGSILSPETKKLHQTSLENSFLTSDKGQNVYFLDFCGGHGQNPRGGFLTGLTILTIAQVLYEIYKFQSYSLVASKITYSLMSKTCMYSKNEG